jgi:hypothetical protein
VQRLSCRCGAQGVAIWEGGNADDAGADDADVGRQTSQGRIPRLGYGHRREGQRARRGEAACQRIINASQRERANRAGRLASEGPRAIGLILIVTVTLI